MQRLIWAGTWLPVITRTQGRHYGQKLVNPQSAQLHRARQPVGRKGHALPQIPRLPTRRCQGRPNGGSEMMRYKLKPAGIDCVLEG